MISLAASIIRRLPAFRGRGRTTLAVNRCFLRAGANPYVVAQMAMGHRLHLDIRLPSHCHAFYTGHYDDAKIEALLSYLQPNGAALDVGANIGFYSVPMALKARQLGGTCILAEPVSENLAILRKNLELNNCMGEILPLGLSDREAETEIVLADDFEAGSVGNAVIADRTFWPEYRRSTIKLDTLDNVWAGSRLDIVKLDIEGHEPQFLAGARQTLNTYRPTLLLEVNRPHYRRRGLNFDEVIPPLLPSNYVFSDPISRRLVPDVANITGFDVLAIPVERT